MSREKTLIKNTAIITIGKISTQLITFFLLPIYTAVLSTAEYGTVDLLNTLISLMLPIVTFQIEQAVFRNLIENRNNINNQKGAITTTLVTVSLQVILYLIVFMIISPLIKNDYKYFLVTNVIANIFSSIFLQISRGLGNNKEYAVAGFISAFITIMLNIVLIVYYKLGAYGMLIGYLIGSVSCSVYLIFSIKIHKYIKIKEYSKRILIDLWKYSLPLIPNAISWWIFNSSDRVIVSSILGIENTGILSAAYKFSGVYITLYNIFNISWTESASLHVNDADSDKYFSNIMNTILRFFAAICLGIIAFMPFAFPLLINEKFAAAYNQIPILMISSFFNVIVGLISVIYIAKKNTKSIAKTSIVSAVINIVVNLSLIKFVGLYAASISTLVSFLAMSINRYLDVRKKYLKITIDKSLMISMTIISIGVFVTYYINNLALNIISALIVTIYAVIINRNTFGTIFKLIKKKFK